MSKELPDSVGPYPSFEVDGMLGGLAKWLRILGFDAVYPTALPSGNRLFVTMKKKTLFGRVIYVRSGKPLQQLAELLEQIQIRPDPDRLLTRCLDCNIAVRPVDRERVRGRVPDRILETKQSFMECAKCGKVYWEGSHSSRIRQRLGALSQDRYRGRDDSADT